MMNEYIFFDAEGREITRVMAGDHDEAVAIAMPDVNQHTYYEEKGDVDFFEWLGI